MVVVDNMVLHRKQIALAVNPEVSDIEIVCVVVDSVRRCFSIATDRDTMPVCQDTTTKPANDEEWYAELVKQLTVDPETNAPVVKDWS